ncbi:MAG TPA: hypothetical protein DDY91_06830, partial [Planctomycetaceae bacterium]|nr:hypothetical protein [Planctomycetaceae bacterium]
MPRDPFCSKTAEAWANCCRAILFPPAKGFQEIAVFGSIVKSDFDEHGSDVDILFQFHDERARTAVARVAAMKTVKAALTSLTPHLHQEHDATQRGRISSELFATRFETDHNLIKKVDRFLPTSRQMFSLLTDR